MKIIGISRVSTAKQFKKGSSVEEQEKQIRTFAQKHKAELIEIIKIQASGKAMVLNHGQLASAIMAAKKTGAVLVVTKLDRLSRDQITLLQLKRASAESGVEIHVSSMDRTISQISDLEFTLLASFAEQERKQIQARIKEATKDRIGPIGLSLNAKALSAKGVAKRQALAVEWAESVGLKDQIREASQNLKRPNLKNVALWLNGKSSVTRRGKSWTFATLQQQVSRLGWNWRELVSA
jgi:DNA invertase Pin-like site-specific DNA recombinase